MDPRRLLIALLASQALSACALLPRLDPASAPAREQTAATPAATAAAVSEVGAVLKAKEANSPTEARVFAAMAPIPNPGPPARPGRTPGLQVADPPALRREAAPTGRVAIAAANAAARETSRARAFLGGVQVFVYDPGRVYEVWTAPLRVTTLTLSPGETIVSKAAGDTVRWQIGETQSGEGANQRAHVMIKPLQRGLETNLVLATSRRVYLLQLRSGAPETFNAAVTWDLGSVLDSEVAAATQVNPAPGLVTPQGPLDAGFRIAPKGRRPAWAPTAVMTDGVRTFLSFPPGVMAGEAPALFALSPGGEAQLVTYRQQGGLWVVDRVLQAAELRLGGRHPQVVRIERKEVAS